MNKFLIDTEESAYDKRHMKRKLEDFYGENIIISGGIGRPLIVTYRQTAHSILQDYFKRSATNDIELEKIQLIEAAARLLHSEIKENVESSKDTFPTQEDLNLEKSLSYIPQLLKLLLSKLFVGKKSNKLETKIAAIGQALIQAVRPRAVMAPLQLGLAVHMHHHFRSRYLLESLHNMGFSSSYNEAIQFERCASVVVSENELDGKLNEDSILKFSADNVDHNICTIDGRNTFHGMGMIAIIVNGSFSSKPVPRIKVADKDILEKSHVSVLFYSDKRSLLQTITFNPLKFDTSEQSFVDILWKSSYYFKNPMPFWSGSMQIIHEKQTISTYNKDTITFLPFYLSYLTDMNCIISTLSHL